MPKHKSRNLDDSPRMDATRALPADTSAQSEGLETASLEITLSTTGRRIGSVAILVYLSIVLLGPLSNPIAPPHLIGPLATQLSPIHRMLFLGHGYRFFAPDPGATHRLVYRGTRADGTEFNGHFPDRENQQPRLLYHRWFMLSERLFFEHNLRQSEEQFQTIRQQYDREILNFRNQGKLKISRQLTQERDRGIEAYKNNSIRFNVLTGAVARILLDRHEGDRIALYVQERTIPFPVEVSNGARLDSEQYLTEQTEIGVLDSTGFHPTAVQTIPDLEVVQ